MQSYKETDSMQVQWTEPETDAQKAYFAKKGALLFKTRSAISKVSWIWMAFAFFGIQLGIAHLLQSYAPPTWLPFLVSGFVVWFIHPYLVTATETYFFDLLDNDPETNSSWVLPALLIIFVLVADRWGNMYIGEKFGYVAKLETTAHADSLRTALDAEDLAAYQTEKADIEALYKEKERSAALPYTAIINDLKRRETIENKRFSTKIAEQKRLRDAATAKVATERSAALEAARAFYEESVAMNKEIHDSNLSNVQLNNERESSRQAASEAMTNYGSWVFAFFFAFAFVGLNYRMASLAGKCNVRPKYTYTPLDKYGGIAGWFVSTFLDIYRRQAVRLAGNIHRVGTKGTSDLSDLDTQLRFGQARYNEPDNDPDPNPDDKLRKLYPRRDEHRPAAAATGTDGSTGSTPVITDVKLIHTDRKARLAQLLNLIQSYHSKWNNPHGGANQTIINWLEGYWQEANEIVASTAAEILGDQLERYQRILNVDIELFSKPRPRDAKKTA